MKDDVGANQAIRIVEGLSLLKIYRERDLDSSELLITSSHLFISPITLFNHPLGRDFGACWPRENVRFLAESDDIDGLFDF